MNVLSMVKITSNQLKTLSKNRLNRIGNGDFEHHRFSFYPWIPSGAIKLESTPEGAFSGNRNIRFYPKQGEEGRVTQRTRFLNVGEMYALLFTARSLGSPTDLFIRLGKRIIQISKESLQTKYSYYILLFRARSKFSSLYFLVKGDKNVVIDLDTISLQPFQSYYKAVDFVV